MAGAPPNINPAKAEIVEIEKESGNPRINLELADGSKVQLEVVVQGIQFLGNDPNTGMPIYGIQTANVLKLHKIGPNRRKVPIEQSENSPGRGFAQSVGDRRPRDDVGGAIGLGGGSARPRHGTGSRLEVERAHSASDQ